MQAFQPGVPRPSDMTPGRKKCKVDSQISACLSLLQESLLLTLPKTQSNRTMIMLILSLLTAMTDDNIVGKMKKNIDIWSGAKKPCAFATASEKLTLYTLCRNFAKW